MRDVQANSRRVGFGISGNNVMQDPQRDRRGCLAVLLGLFGRGEEQSAEATSQAEAEAGRIPATHVYRLRDDFMSAAEVSLFHVLRNVLVDRALIFPKVRLADLIDVPKQEGQYGALQRINRKHIDFVLCDAKTLRPILALELDDRSHRRPDRIERDAFVDQVFSDSGLPLVHVPVQHSYDSRAIASLIAQAAPALLTGSTASPASANPAAGSHA